MKTDRDATPADNRTAAQLYSGGPTPLGERLTAYLDRVADVVGSGGFILELGSGPGWSAKHLESKYLRVRRTDAAPAFVDIMRADGHEADVLDVRKDAFGGPYDAIVATAALLHLTRDEFENVLHRAKSAVAPDGALAFTIKSDIGSAWNTAQLGSHRHFTYWRESEIRDALARTGWAPVLLEHVNFAEPWIFVLATSSTDLHP